MFIVRFADAVTAWLEYFPSLVKEDFMALGLRMDCLIIEFFKS